MVRKRSNPDSESKMPVKDSSKEQPQVQRDVESASMSDKDNSDYSSKGTKVWSRELRNRFVIANEKRSLRFTNPDVRSGRHLRSCRMAITSRQHYTLSQSDDDDDHIFTPRPSSRRLRLRHVKRRHASPDPGPSSGHHTQSVKRSRNSAVLNGHGMKSVNHSREEEEHEEGAGIRRSTRQRKLKYENYSTSWIVGAQTLRGYPMYGNSYNSCPDNVIKREEEDDEKVGVEGGVSGEDRREDQGATVEGGESGPFEDMYSRVKRTRARQPVLYQEKPRPRRVLAERKCRQRVNTSTESESSSEEEEEAERNHTRVEERKYHLRKTKPTVERFQAHVDQPVRRSSRTIRAVLYKSVRRHRRARASSSSSSSSSTSSEDERFDRKKNKSLTKGRTRCLTQSLGEEAGDGIKPEAGGRLADVDPVSVDTSIRFSDVGGLEAHVRCLQEMVVFPMLYSEVFRKYHVSPPKGVLFHGPPGTGKTLIARALANECSQGERKVAFFIRKGADCLSKWVGESERQLRLLFEQAYQSRPSIIFFDEIDGLAPVRSAKQDQIHASIVSTLLALMDGLDDRGEIIVIGATNRIDAIDPALRRPGRFDRELLFPLPANKERQEILKIHVSKWEKPPAPSLITRLAEMSAGYCGSDLRALCSEAVIQALRRRYPQIYKSNRKLLLNPDNVKVERCDFEIAQRGIVPASYRSAPAFGHKLPQFMESLLGVALSELTAHVKHAFPCGFAKASRSMRMVKSPRLLVLGQRKATSLVTAALLHRMEHCPVHTLDLATIYGESARSPEEATVQVLNEVRRSVPAILYIPSLGEWWTTVGGTVRAVFKSLLGQLDPSLPILLLATAITNLPLELQHMFSGYRNEIYTIKPFTIQQKEQFFKPLFLVRAVKKPPPAKIRAPLEELPVAPPPSPPKLNEEQLKNLYDKEENTLRELRIFLRQICAKLARNRQFFMFSKPVDINEVPDYLSIIKEPMDLETMMTKIDLHKYTCAQDFLNDIELICRNALEYNPDRDPADKLIRHRACYLRDTAYALIKAEMDSDFEDKCRGIRSARSARAASPDRFAPEFVRTSSTLPIDKPVEQVTTANNSENADTTNVTENQQNSVASVLSAEHKQSASKSILSCSDPRKKKRRNPWSRGLLKKKSVRPKSLSLTGEGKSDGIRKSSTPPCRDDDTSFSCVDDGIQQGLDSQAHSTPTRKRRRNSSTNEQDTVIVNGVENMSSETDEDDKGSRDGDKEAGSQMDESVVASDCSYATEPTSKQGKDSSTKTVVVNRAALSRLLGETVSATRNIVHLELLIDLYAQLRCVISRFSKSWNRSKLPQELELELNRFVNEHKEYEEEVNESLNTTRDDVLSI